MTALWTSADAAAATGGDTGQWEATGVSIDTRTLQAGDLFVALKAARDGHDFVVQALEAGAAAALVSHIPDGADPARCLLVEDVLTALEDLGRAARARTDARIAAITGSVGKTSAKEMLRAALTGQGRVHAAEASYNNHWGVPLTLARMPQDTEFGIFEIGMNHPGEIAPLAAQVQPHVALVTTVGTAHLEAFDDVDGIAREKAAIYSGLVSDAQCEPTAIVNADLPNTSILMDAARAHAARIHTFGEADGAGYHLKAATLHDDCTVVEATADRRSLLFKIQSPGRHFAANALGVLATAEAMGADPTLSMLGLSRWQPPAGRGTREALLLDAAMEDSVIFLIDDAFNANPTSMAASLDVLAAATPTDQIGRVAKGRRIAVLGEMLELGTEAARLHAQIADHPGIAQLDTVHCVGDLMHNLYTALPDHLRGRWVETAAELASDAHRLIDAGDVVLVKGSKGSQVSRVVDALRKLGHPRGQPDKAE